MIVQSVQRALSILALFSHARPRWGISEIAQAAGLAKATTHNIVNTLVAAGFLSRDGETRRYRLGAKLFTLGAVMGASLEINQKASGPAYQLASTSGLVCRVAIWDGDAALITLNITPPYDHFLAQQIGPRVVAYCTALGRALLAHLELETVDRYLRQTALVAFTPKTVTDRSAILSILEKTRRLGYAINDQELAIGQSNVAAPIFQQGGILAGALSLTGSSEMVMGERMEAIVGSLRRTASEISKFMGYFPSAPENRMACGQAC
jgi:DNA-binding IclR family transcriptional regulator